MTTRITLALALVFAALATVPASAQPRGHYDTSALRLSDLSVRQLGHDDRSLLRLSCFNTALCFT